MADAYPDLPDGIDVRIARATRRLVEDDPVLKAHGIGVGSYDLTELVSGPGPARYPHVAQVLARSGQARSGATEQVQIRTQVYWGVLVRLSNELRETDYLDRRLAHHLLRILSADHGELLDEDGSALTLALLEWELGDGSVLIAGRTGRLYPVRVTYTTPADEASRESTL